jgi:hypothetical protein
MTRAIENYDRTWMSTTKSLQSDMAQEKVRGRVVGDAGRWLGGARGIANEGIA